MIPTLNTPTIVITVGRQSRMYHAFITSAPIRLDAPSTLTLLTGTLSEIALLGVNDIALDATRARSFARAILVDAAELSWQRARCREAGHLLAPADAGLVSADALQRWLWQRLRTPLEVRMPAKSA